MTKSEFELLSKEDKIKHLKRAKKIDKTLLTLGDIFTYGFGIISCFTTPIVDVEEEEATVRSIENNFKEQQLKALKEFQPKTDTSDQNSVNKALTKLSTKEMEYVKGLQKAKENSIKRYKKHKMWDGMTKAVMRGTLLGIYGGISMMARRKTNEYYDKEFKKILDSDKSVETPKKK